MDRYVSGRQRSLKVGIKSYSENSTSLEVIGNVGIGTTLGTSKLTVIGDGLFTGIVTAAAFSGDGSRLTGVIGQGSGVQVSDDGNTVGTAAAIDFGVGLAVSFANGVATVDGSSVSNLVEDISNDTIYYPVLSPVTSGTISSISVASNAIVFNPSTGFLGIGTTSPKSPLDIWTGDGNVRFGDVVDFNQTTDNGIQFIPSRYGQSQAGITSYKTGLFTEVNGRILSYGINVIQLERERDINFPGGIFRIDTRSSGGWADSSAFVVKRQPVGLAKSQGDIGEVLNAIVIKLNTGDSYTVPNGGTLYVGTASTLSLTSSGPVMPKMGSSNIKLQVGAASTPQDAYISGKLSIGTTSQTNTLQIGEGSSLFVVSNDGRLGMGTTNPTSTLHVVGNTLITGVTTSSGGFVGNLTGIASTAQGLTGTPNISVGILTASSGNFSGIVTSSSLNVFGISTISVNSASNALRINQLGSGNALVVEDKTNPDITPFVITASGSVGVGTTNPASKLTVQGDGLFTGIVTAAAFSGDGSRLTGVIGQGSGVQVSDDGNTVGTAAAIDFGNNLSVASFSSGIATVTSSISISSNTTNQNQYLTYAPAIGSTTGLGVTSNLVFNQSTGNLGIGTTNPTSSLDVDGNGKFSGIITASAFYGSGIGLTGLVSNEVIDINNNQLHYPILSPVTSGTVPNFSVSSSSIVFNPANSYLGIGTTNPTSRLTVQGDGLFAGIVTATSFSGDGSLLTGVTAASVISISSNTTNQNQYLTYAPAIGSTTGLGVTSNLVFNQSTGNLGIGTTNPTSSLDVIGDINTSTDIKINGQSIRESSINDAIIFSIALG